VADRTKLWKGFKKKALVIGVSDYKVLDPLDFSAEDAKQVSEVLKTLQFEIPTERKIIGKVDDYDTVRRKISNFFGDEDLTPKDILLFYFSGHGVPDNDILDHYFAFSDLDPDHPDLDGYSFDDLLKHIEGSHSNRIIVILDCCYSGAAAITARNIRGIRFKGKAGQKNAAVLANNAINNSAANKMGRGRYLLAACQGYEEAFSTKKQDHSIFTYYLLNGLKGADGKSVNQRGNLTPDSLGSYISEEILSLPNKERPRQKPIRKVDNAESELVLAYYPGYVRDNTMRTNGLENDSDNFAIPLPVLNDVLLSGDFMKQAYALNTLIMATQVQKNRATGEMISERYAKNATFLDIILNNVEIMVFDAKNKETWDASPASKNDTAATETFYNLGMTHNFFKNVYDRNSIDNNGLGLDAYIHYGDKYNNAFWSDQRIFVLGDGDGHIFQRLTKCIDVIASEYMKGVIEFDISLPYSGQSGVIIEHYASVFGSLAKQYDLNQVAEQADWIIGNDLLMPGINGVGLYSLKEPGTAYNDPLLGGKDSQVSHLKYYDASIAYDNGGAHIFSGILNHAFFIIATEIGGRAWNEAGRIWYDSLKSLKARSTFQNLADITFITAGNIYGKGSREQKAVSKGWGTVGIKVG
jgi:Thermolysin metallopeptidase, alpha-helical domain/Thermolysin metallopeptidase, catalytic domain/Caspase domain